MKYFFFLLTMGMCESNVEAQLVRDSVKVVVNKMFTAMKNADAALSQSCFADSMILQTIAINKEGNIIIQNENPADFINFISKELPGNADERISFETIKTDGLLAMAWTPYTFYYKGQFSHCGVNSFQLVRFKGEWKIQYIIDTRNKKGCNE